MCKECYWWILPSMYEEVRKHLKEILEIGGLLPLHRPWASPVILVHKKDSKLWFCIYLRKLNVCTIKDSYSLPRIEDTLDSLNGAVWFTALDLKSGYWQVKIDEASEPLTAFTVSLLGFYLWSYAFQTGECSSYILEADAGMSGWPSAQMVCHLSQWHYSFFSKMPKDYLVQLRAAFEKHLSQWHYSFFFKNAKRLLGPVEGCLWETKRNRTRIETQ